MFKYFVFLCLVVSFCAYAHEQRSEGRIIGGHPVEITEYPYEVSLQFNEQHVCGGSIIGNGRFILTAAHCVRSQDPKNPKNLKVRVGSSFHNSGGQLIAVQKFEADDKSDTAVLRLEKNIITSATAKPIILNTNEINFGQSATVSGWGLTKENDNKISEQLQAVSVNIFSQSDCIKAYESLYQIRDTEFCAGIVDGGKDSCQGDSGGPLAVNGVLYGIVSWGVGCGRTQYPGVYVDVAKIGPWIKIAMLKLAFI